MKRGRNKEVDGFEYVLLSAVVKSFEFTEPQLFAYKLHYFRHDKEMKLSNEINNSKLHFILSLHFSTMASIPAVGKMDGDEEIGTECFPNPVGYSTAYDLFISFLLA